MAELADAIDLGSIVDRRAGSSPVIRIRFIKSKPISDRNGFGFCVIGPASGWRLAYIFWKYGCYSCFPTCLII